ncbi:MAG: sodium:calcium antiporter [Candidatus Nealsonbacteria bacterium]|nr:sodium:calcium antiporter [Candidatus Nealsonbacteria bacterium]
MTVFLHVLIFIVSGVLLAFAGKFIITALIKIARVLCWKEFVVAFFIMAFAGSLPNFFVGISAALRGIPELAFGDVVGGNLADLTIVLALATLFAKGLPAASKTIQTSSIFTLVVAILPILLILDGKLGRIDGIILILFFAMYIAWLFSKDERFKKTYDTPPCPVSSQLKEFLKDIGIMVAGIALILLAAQGIVTSALFFADYFNLSLVLIGILVVGLGNCMPETYFSIVSAKKGEGWLVLGDLMGTVIVAATLVLGVVALISPIIITDFSPFAIARIFLVLAAVFFLTFVRTGQKITRKEAIFLLSLYIIFLITEILTK